MIVGRFAAALAGYLAVAGASDARAACRPAAPLVAASPGSQPLVDRYRALVAEDPYLLTGKTAPRWRALVDELKRDGGRPADLVAASEMMLAGSLHGDATVQEGLAAAQDALARAEGGGIKDGALHAALLTMLAVKEHEARKAPQAAAHADAALAEAERAEGKESWAYGNAAMAAADAAGSLGKRDREEPLAATAERLAAACLPPDTSIIGGMMSSHGAVLQIMGRVDEALAEHERAVAWDAAHLPDSDPVVPYALGQLAFTLQSVNRRLEAEALLRRAVTLYARHHPELIDERASTIAKLYVLLVLRYDQTGAGAMWAAWQDVAARAHHLNPLVEGGMLGVKADSLTAHGEVDQALALRERAVALMESSVPPDDPGLIAARTSEANLLAATGHPREAWAIVQASHERKAPGGPARNDIVASSIGLAAGVDAPAVYAQISPAAAQLEAQLRAAAASRGNVARFAGSFDEVVRVALAAHQDEAAFHALQLTNLSEAMVVGAEATARRAAAEPAVRSLIDRFTARERDHRRLDRDRIAANAGGNTATALTLDAAIRRNDEDAAQALRELDRVFPAYRSLSRPQPVALAAFRASLGPDDVLLAPVSLLGETLVVTVTREDLRWTVLPIPSWRVVALARRVLLPIDASLHGVLQPFDTAAARALAAILLPPALAPVFASHRHLIYYAHGFLNAVPPALLVTAPASAGAAPAWLIRSHSISVATSLAPRAGTGDAPRDGFLGVGAPALAGQPLTLAMRGVEVKVGDFGKPGVPQLPPLPDAERELRVMGAMFPADQRRVLTGAAATKPALASLPLDRYGVIAFATHGLLADALPGLTEPALVLTPAPGIGAANDGLLTAGEIAGLRLDADLVILSACRSGRGADIISAYYGGLASAFMQAGARALLVSQWPVRDDAAERISVATLAATRRGVDRATALQQAMLALMRDPKVAGAANPAVWAPFVLVDR